MRITFLFSTLWLSGGVRDAIEIANGLARRGHKIAIVAPGGTFDPGIAPEIDPSIDLRATPVQMPDPHAAGTLHRARVSWSLAQTAPKSDFIISTQTPTTAAGFIATRLLGRGHPVWFFQDYLEMFIGRPVETWLCRNAMKWNRLALVLSESSREELQRYQPGADVEVVRVGLSHAEAFHPLPPEERVDPDGRRRILYLGDMRPRKGLYDFLAAAEILYQRLPDIHLWIVSKEDCQIQSLVPFEYIHRPPRPELARLMAVCDAFVSASWWESFGIPPLEAMACGAPVVLTDSRGVREFARPDENCLMTPIRNRQALADALERVLTDAELAERLRRAGPPTAAEFTWEESIDRFERALKKNLIRELH